MSIPGFELFDLHGDNWLADSEKPVAILWGFNPWKRDFVSRYLPEYRVAFVRGKTALPRLLLSMDALDNLHFFVWSYSESPELADYAKRRNIPLSRMEDGFVRSADLGSKHSTALSLAIDDEGLYFDATRPSRLERILNEHDFSSTPELLSAARSLLQIMRDQKISKYNLGSLSTAGRVLGPRFRKRVLVIGQVEGDASICYGLAEGWTNLRLIKLAREENPGADILYKPHPDVAKGYRVNSHSLEAYANLCQILTEELMLAELFQAVDHVYTITSLSGFEALIQRVKVTTVGAPFYAGWGLADDRVQVKRRKRRLSLEEVFCAAYLIYPRYLPDLSDNVRGCLAAIIRVTADRRKALDAHITPALARDSSHKLLASEYWPVVFRKDIQPILEAKFKSKLNSVLPMQRVFHLCHGDHFQRSLAYLVCGKFHDSAAFSKILKEIRISIKPSYFIELLDDLMSIRPTPSLLELWASYKEQADQLDEAQRALEHLAFNNDFPVDASKHLPISARQYPYFLKLAQFALRHRRLEDAYRLFNHLLLSGHLQGDVISGIAEIARLRFDFSSSAFLLTVFNHFDPHWRVGYGHFLEAQAHALAGNATYSFESMALACDANPQYVESVAAIGDVLALLLGRLPYAEAALAANEIDDSGSVLARAKALIAHEHPAQAERLLFGYQPHESETLKYCLMLSLAYSYQGKLDEAKRLVVNLLPSYPTILLYREGMRLAVLMNDYTWGQSLVEEAAAKGIDVGEMYRRKIALGLGAIKEAYLSFRDMARIKVLNAYLGERYVQSLVDVSKQPNDKNVILAFFGPGDEIRFASFYREMRSMCGESEVVFTCDPRLFPLLQRHYTDLNFVPSARVRNLVGLNEYSQHKELPGSDLHPFFDNSGWDLVRDADNVILVTDALGDVIEGYDSFKGETYLKADPGMVAKWKERLHPYAKRPLVGLSWRSSLTTYARNEHYLTINEVLPLLESDAVQFVNLQSDNCEEELRFVERLYPGRIINFSDLDQFNDLDSTAALISNLDLVIAPATTVFELSAAIGTATWLLSNSSELHWRRRPGSSVDVWHSALTHVEAGQLGNKKELVAEAARRLAVWSKSNYKISMESA